MNKTSDTKEEYGKLIFKCFLAAVFADPMLKDLNKSNLAAKLLKESGFADEKVSEDTVKNLLSLIAGQQFLQKLGTFPYPNETKIIGRAVHNYLSVKLLNVVSINENNFFENLTRAFFEENIEILESKKFVAYVHNFFPRKKQVAQEIIQADLSVFERKNENKRNQTENPERETIKALNIGKKPEDEDNNPLLKKLQDKLFLGYLYVNEGRTNNLFGLIHVFLKVYSRDNIILLTGAAKYHGEILHLESSRLVVSLFSHENRKPLILIASLKGYETGEIEIFKACFVTFFYSDIDKVHSSEIVFLQVLKKCSHISPEIADKVIQADLCGETALIALLGELNNIHEVKMSDSYFEQTNLYVKKYFKIAFPETPENKTSFPRNSFISDSLENASFNNFCANVDKNSSKISLNGAFIYFLSENGLVKHRLSGYESNDCLRITPSFSLYDSENVVDDIAVIVEDLENNFFSLELSTSPTVRLSFFIDKEWLRRRLPLLGVIHGKRSDAPWITAFSVVLSWQEADPIEEEYIKAFLSINDADIDLKSSFNGFKRCKIPINQDYSGLYRIFSWRKRSDGNFELVQAIARIKHHRSENANTLFNFVLGEIFSDRDTYFLRGELDSEARFEAKSNSIKKTVIMTGRPLLTIPNKQFSFVYTSFERNLNLQTTGQMLWLQSENDNLKPCVYHGDAEDLSNEIKEIMKILNKENIAFLPEFLV